MIMIRSFAQELPDGSYETGAFCPLNNIEAKGLVMIDKLHGKVISIFERSYRYDCDFVATIRMMKWEFPKMWFMRPRGHIAIHV